MSDQPELRVVRGADRPTVHRPHSLPTLQKLVNSSTGATAMTILINELTTGESVPPHVHEVEEVLVVVTGSCAVAAGDQHFEVHAGDAVIVPAGVLHGFVHSGRDRTKVVAAIASPTALPD